MTKLRWTREAINEFREWHETLMAERKYPESICKELRRFCDKFLSQA